MTGLTIAGRTFGSRLLVGTGKFSSNQAMASALDSPDTNTTTRRVPQGGCLFVEQGTAPRQNQLLFVQLCQSLGEPRFGCGQRSDPILEIRGLPLQASFSLRQLRFLCGLPLRAWYITSGFSMAYRARSSAPPWPVHVTTSASWAISAVMLPSSELFLNCLLRLKTERASTSPIFAGASISRFFMGQF